MSVQKSFKPGDIVQLKSGGPPMTVVEFDAYHQAFHCEWFKGASLEKANIAEAALKLYVAPKKDE